jgi:hypothetical protein
MHMLAEHTRNHPMNDVDATAMHAQEVNESAEPPQDHVAILTANRDVKHHHRDRHCKVSQVRQVGQTVPSHHTIKAGLNEDGTAGHWKKHQLAPMACHPASV